MDPHSVNPRALELIEKMLSPENREANYYAQKWASDIHPLTNDMSVAVANHQVGLWELSEAFDLSARHFRLEISAHPELHVQDVDAV
jgi:hypothetical protein